MLTKKNFKSGTKSFGAIDYLISLSLFAILLTCTFLFIATVLGFVFFRLPFPLKLTNTATISALYIASFVSSFAISKRNGQKYFVCALFNSFLLATVLLILSLFGDNGIFSTDFLLRLVCVPTCFLGAFLGIKRNKIKKRKPR